LRWMTQGFTLRMVWSSSLMIITHKDQGTVFWGKLPLLRNICQRS
jgi:hypothetical protein